MVLFSYLGLGVGPGSSMLLAALLLTPAGQAAAELGAGAGAGDTARTVDEEAIARSVWEHAPGVIDARRELVEAESAADQVRLLPNPNLAGSWATIPVGPRNPPGESFAQIPSYSVGISELVEVGKRGPRRRAADAVLAADRFKLEDAYRQSFFAVMESLADQAAATARAAALARLAEGSAESLALQRLRSERGDVAGLDVDRIEVDHLRLLSRITETSVEREAARRTCALALGQACPRLDDSRAALAFLERGLAPPRFAVDGVRIDDLPEVKALHAERAAAGEERLLASRLRIPDPTIGVAFTHDQFTVAGNQANSLTLSVGMPLPLFDRGQVAARRAERHGEVLDAALSARREAARAAFHSAARQLELVRTRAGQLDEGALPRARSVVARMEAAAHRGGAAWTDVLLARRALEELQLERIEIAAEAHKLLLALRSVAGALPDAHAVHHGRDGP
jgi:outer membrane protein, heavy metal efflux system